MLLPLPGFERKLPHLLLESRHMDRLWTGEFDDPSLGSILVPEVNPLRVDAFWVVMPNSEVPLGSGSVQLRGLRGRIFTFDISLSPVHQPYTEHASVPPVPEEGLPFLATH